MQWDSWCISISGWGRSMGLSSCGSAWRGLYVAPLLLSKGEGEDQPFENREIRVGSGKVGR